MLRYLAEHGGAVSLSELHDYSERRFFVAHRGFSELMEALVADEVVLWDASSGIATLTDAGRAELEAN